MSKIKFFKWMLCFILIIVGRTIMNAQTISKTSDLNPGQRSLVTISALTAKGDLENLNIQLHIALDEGLTVNETKEVLVQLYAYCGFPRSLNAINTFMGVLEERKLKGIIDKQGPATTNRSDTADKYEQGRKVLEQLTGTPQAKPAPGFGEFAPRVDAFLKEHLFGDIFESDVLTYQQRELVTISALAAMPGVEPQLQAHIKMGINTGITNEQLVEVANMIAKLVSKTQANVLYKLINKPELPVIAADMMVRISEIEVLPDFLEEYKSILKEESAVSVKIEPGVIALFAMYQKENPVQVRIVEIYANKEAYQSHLKTPHFQQYKTTTMKMVKSLKLVDMTDVDTQTMPGIFKKIN
ncbi:carboxymuconolactone decarboxylase family protein [Pedobacter sp. BMA]|uniref:carboxymuconolactone decarboxylase family protein n=1 Tax=Pedobacter sp. BMA TaxID=1663685 RepID=UPI00069D3AED|nr:carboxymuconolactone decarboxylase family protein [Pedobacter sp. BMA]